MGIAPSDLLDQPLLFPTLNGSKPVSIDCGKFLYI